jgi:hypothetical protein
VVAIFGFDGGISIFDALDFVLIFETMERDNAASQPRRSGQRRRVEPSSSATAPPSSPAFEARRWAARRRRRDGGRGGGGGWSYFCRGAEDADGDADCLRWDRAPQEGEEEGGGGRAGAPRPTRPAHARGHVVAHAPADDDAIESGESSLSLYHRSERDRIEAFCRNGFRFDGGEDGAAGAAGPAPDGGGDADRTADGERIVGCLVGAFLPS